MRQIQNDINIATPLIEDFKDENGQVVQDKEPEYYLEGVFLQANEKNRNGRIYPMEVMKPEVDRYIREYVDTGRAYGQLNHPDAKETPNINLEKVSHIITKIWQEGNYFKARAKILDTPTGRIVKAMIKEHCQLGVSSRAMGSVTMRNGTAYVNPDFRLVTAGDIVWEPSAQTAFPKGLIEDVEWEYDPNTGNYTEKEATPFHVTEEVKEEPKKEENEVDKLKVKISELTEKLQAFEDKIKLDSFKNLLKRNK